MTSTLTLYASNKLISVLKSLLKPIIKPIDKHEKRVTKFNILHPIHLYINLFTVFQKLTQKIK